VKQAVCCLLLILLMAAKDKKPKPDAIEQWRQAPPAAAAAAPPPMTGSTPGSLYVDGSRYSDWGRDLRAGRVGDLLTILVSDRSAATAGGTTRAARKTSASAQVSSLFGSEIGNTPLGKPVRLGGSQQLEGDGETTRSNTFEATVSARVVEIFPNGDLLVEGVRKVTVNSEVQNIRIRGIVRWNDVSRQNTIPSDRIGQMELTVNGRGVVGDVVRRPNILYRMLLGILPY
jgi:flagellar L-ring protein FlgH